jgi:hypothetical protein
MTQSVVEPREDALRVCGRFTIRDFPLRTFLTVIVVKTRTDARAESCMQLDGCSFNMRAASFSVGLREAVGKGLRQLKAPGNSDVALRLTHCKGPASRIRVRGLRSHTPAHAAGRDGTLRVETCLTLFFFSCDRT